MKRAANGTTPTAPRQDDRSGKGQVSGSGLVLDNFLSEVQFARKYFELRRSCFEMKQLESFAKATPAIKTLLAKTVSRHQGRVYAKPCPLLTELGTNVFGPPINSVTYSGHEISSASVELVLQKTLELGLQTIVELPPRDPKVAYSSKKLLSLAAALTKLGKRVTSALLEQELLERVRFILGEDHGNRSRLMQVGEEIQWAGRSLSSIAKRKLVRMRPDSPNPQIRFALYLAGWIKVCTGRPH